MISRHLVGLAVLCLVTLASTPATAQPVLPAAGSIPAKIDLRLTGDPAGADFVRANISAALVRAITPTLTPGSVIDASQVLPQPQPLGRGFLTSFAVPVRIAPGPNAMAVTGTTVVDVENLALGDVRPTRLAFHDDPEQIVASGVLSRTIVQRGDPTRIYYYHENRRQPRRFAVVFAANGSVRTRLRIVQADAGPNIDVMTVGHVASRVALIEHEFNEGSVVEIVGGRPIVVRDTRVGPGDGIVGALTLQVFEGGPVTVTILAIPPDASIADYLYAPTLPGDGHGRHGIFDLADFGERIIAYSGGGRDARYVYGSRQQTPPNADPHDAGRDFGDYGVVQRVTFDLANPGSAPATFYLYEKPLGGAVRSSFLVNDRLIELGCARVAQPYLIASATLAPHATDALRVVTMTDGGSSYPLEVGVSSLAPFPVTPPIAAADGCFPKPGGPPAAQPPSGAPGL